MQQNTTKRQARCSWLLPQGHAQTFRPRTAGHLRVTGGRVWVTMSHPHQAPLPEGLSVPAEYDLFLDRMTSLPLRAGQPVVIEAWPAEPAPVTTLTWEAADFGSAAQLWQQTVAQPASELAQGLRHDALTFGKMVRGFLAYIPFALPHRRWHM